MADGNETRGGAARRLGAVAAVGVSACALALPSFALGGGDRANATVPRGDVSAVSMTIAPLRAAPAEADSLFADYRGLLADARDEAGFATYVLQPGEDLGDLLRRAGGQATGVEDALDGAGIATPADGEAIDLAVERGADGEAIVRRLRFFPGAGAEAHAWRDEGAWRAALTERPATVTHVAAASVMTDSLFGAGARAGVPREVMARLANLFLYDVDFVRDIRAEDRFEVVYEVRYDADGRPVGTGDIVFAAMSWRGGRRAKEYYRYDDAPGEEARYFDARGASAQRLLMKTPIEGARVTSRFGPRRHPTLGYTKAHKGVDFGARAGTPIMAAGDGTVMRAGPLGSYGNFLLIRHANGYETAYAHLKGFAEGVSKGARVRQGDVVAYVGSTGRSTGPHLHYEVRAEGRHVNPMKLDVATGSVLSGDALADFAEVRRAADAMRARPFAVATGD